MPRQPPVTPSPHRFLAGKQKSPSPTKDANPRPGFRKHATQPTTSASKSTPRFQTSSQFAATPRFSFGRRKTTQRGLRSPSPPKPAVVQSVRANTRPNDEVEDATNANEDDEMLFDERASVLPTTEHEGDGQQWRSDLAFSPKRRRLDDADPLVLTRPNFKQPGASASEMNRAAPQYTHVQHSTPTSTTSEHSSWQRPAFIRPSTQHQDHNEPLPETFSPHKRGQKFVPGGMATTVQQWVIETGQAAVQSRKGQGYLRGEDYVMRAKVESLTGDGTFTAHAMLPNGDAIHLILAANRLPSAAQSQEVTAGCVVGIRAPTWEVELDGQIWTVCVDWRVLS